MYTAKEVAEVEDHIYATVNTKIRFGSHQNSVAMSAMQLDTIGVGKGRDRHHGDKHNSDMFLNSYKGKSQTKAPGHLMHEMGNYGSVSRSQALNPITSNYAATISQTNAALSVTNKNFARRETELAKQKLQQ